MTGTMQIGPNCVAGGVQAHDVLRQVQAPGLPGSILLRACKSAVYVSLSHLCCYILRLVRVRLV